MENLGLAFSVIVTLIGATWALRSALSAIELALKEHVAANAEAHKAMEGRIVKLEAGRRRK